MPSKNLQRVLDKIDAFNAGDPRKEKVDGKDIPYELAYARRLTEWAKRLNPNPSEELLIVARGQHVGRWGIPRDRYERTRVGYLHWRETLKEFHAKKVGDFMREEGYPPESIARVAGMIKKRYPRDPDTQTVEDALCLVFLQTQFEDLLKKTTEEKMLDILRKTWKKMSAQGREQALALDLPPDQKALIGRALNPQG